MKKLCLLMALILLFSGCSGILENDYRTISPHAEESSEPLPEDAQLRAGTYGELKSAILRLVYAGRTEGIVRLHNYVGDANRDVSSVCREVLRAEPIGAYALDFISHVITPVISDYDVALSLTYRRTLEQISAVRSITGPADFEESFTEVVCGFGTGLTFETNLYNPEQYDFAQILSRIYYDNPVTAQGFPEFAVSLYPDTGLRRVVELELSYPDTLVALGQRSEKCAEAAQSIVDGLDGELDVFGKAGALYDALGSICDFDSEMYGTAAEGQRLPATTYDAFFGVSALPESYALAYKLLCDMAEIPCLVVLGRRGADEHAWNLIELDGDWFHVDLASDDMGEATGRDYFLKNDTFMQIDYRWDTHELPVAEGEPPVDEPPEDEEEQI